MKNEKYEITYMCEHGHLEQHLEHKVFVCPHLSTSAGFHTVDGFKIPNDPILDSCPKRHPYNCTPVCFAYQTKE